MSSRKLKQNDENLCPISSKRTKTTELEKQTDSPHKSFKATNLAWISAKIESTSSPSGLSNEYLEEMGVGILDSEESSSSASCIINFGAASNLVVDNTDENCNESAPNLDDPEFHHQQRSSKQTFLDQTNNSPLDSDNNTAEQNIHIGININDNISLSSFEIFTDESCQQMSERKNWPQHKAISALADSPAGLGIGNGHKRSPLAIVDCNSQNQNAQSNQQFQSTSPNQYVVTGFSVTATKTPNVVALLDAPFTTQSANLQLETSLSPQQPTTSRQAALMRSQQQEKLCEIPQKAEIKPAQQKTVSNAITPKIDDFFIFRNQQLRDRACNNRPIDHFSLLSDEVILHIFKWLPKKTLLRCGLVCRRFYQCSTDESLWSRLDLGGRSLRPEAIQNILGRGVVVLRLAQTNFREPVFPIPSPHITQPFQSKLQYLDLSLAQIDKCSLRILLSYCRQLKKLSLEHVPLNNDICNEISENTNLEALNLAMCTGLEAWSIRKMLKPLKNLNSLNISWTNLSVDAVTSLVTHISPNLLRLNVAGCRKTMFDTHIASLSKRCPQIIELDLSDCTGLTGGVIMIFSNFKQLEYLSLSRCYLIPAMAYLDLKHMHSIAFLDVFGTLNDDAINLLETSLVGLGINKFVHSSVARPTVGSRRTSIWGLRTRD